LRLRIVVLLGVVVSSVVGSVPAADAIGGAACTITGTISFLPPSDVSGRGAWSIDPAAINCQGAVNGYHFLGQGPFTGSGSSTGIPADGGACLHQVGTGTVEYTIQTAAMDHHIRESWTRFTLAGAGAFTTPSLRGSLALLPPYDGDCVTKPVTKATFVAQAFMPKTAPFFLIEKAAP
jgi:hypothetical protein